MSRLLIASALALSVSISASADPLLDMMRALSKDGPVYAYEMTYSSSDFTAKGTIDPSQPEGERIQVTEPGPSEWSDDFRDGLKEMDAEADGDIWCADFADRVPDTAALSEENEDTAVYTFTPLPEADAEKNEKKMMKQLDASVTLDTSDGSVLAFNMRLPEPFKPAMVAKINAFEMSASCARAPDGRTFVESFNFAIEGSAMMQSFSETVSREITQLLDPVG